MIENANPSDLDSMRSNNKITVKEAPPKYCLPCDEQKQETLR